MIRLFAPQARDFGRCRRHGQLASLGKVGHKVANKILSDEGLQIDDLSMRDWRSVANAVSLAAGGDASMLGIEELRPEWMDE